VSTYLEPLGLPALTQRLRDAGDLARVPVERRGEQGPRVTERYRLDDKGMVDVIIRDQDSGYERSYRLGRI